MESADLLLILPALNAIQGCAVSALEIVSDRVMAPHGFTHLTPD